MAEDQLCKMALTLYTCTHTGTMKSWFCKQLSSRQKAFSTLNELCAQMKYSMRKEVHRSAALLFRMKVFFLSCDKTMLIKLFMSAS